jgi:parvulin-like peptidyl-prolyl isomerase
VLEKLPDNQISEVVKTQRGYHLLLIQAREAAVQKPFEAVRDRVRQAMLNERFPVFLKSLEERYPVEWKLPTRPSRNGG